MSSPQTKLSVYLGDKLIHEQVLAPGDYIIGQEDGAEIRFAAEKLGARHARLRLGVNQWMIEDLGSQAGTFLNEAPVTDAASFSPSDTIRIGATRMVLGPAPVEAPAPRPISVTKPQPEEMRGPRKYEVGEVIARGGMGVILSARQVVVQREVAMKLMHDSTRPEAVTRFFQEAQITAQLEHPNIVPIHELSINEQGQPFYTMKLVRGVSLKEVIDRLVNGDPEALRQWPLNALLTVFQKLCDALAFAHARSVIHRDLKPDNIMLGEYGEALVMDWGIAKVLTRESESPRVSVPSGGESDSTSPDASRDTVGPTIGTIFGSVMGTPQYMPPEQANGEVEMMDERTDIYSLGAILYHLLALSPPFPGRNSAEVLLNVRAGKIVPFEDACADRKLPHLPGGRLPKSLGAVALHAMAFEKDNRYQSVKALQADIAAYQSGFATSAENASAWKLASLFIQRHRTIAFSGGMLVIAGLIFGINLVHERNRAEHASAQAVAARRTADLQRDSAEDQLYLSDMLQAGRHIADGRPDNARALLDRHRLEPSGRDMRGWEWFHLSGRLNQERLRVEAHAGGVFTVAVNADGSRVASGGADGEIAVWQTRGLVPEFRLRTPGGVIHSISWHGEGKLLASADSLGNVRVWNLDGRNMVGELRAGAGQPLRSVAWRPNDGGIATLAIAGLEREIYLWQPFAQGDAARPQVFGMAASAVASLHWSPDGQKLAVGEMNSGAPLAVFDYATHSKILSSSADAGNDVFAVAIDPTGKNVAAGAKHLVVTVYNIADKTRLFDERMHRGFVSALAWSPDGKQLASASHDGTIRVFAPINGKEEGQVFSGHSGEVNALAWSRLPSVAGANTRNTALFSGGADGTLRAWTTNTGAGISPKPENWISAASWSPDGRRIAAANFRDFVHIVDPLTGLGFPIFSSHGNVFDAEWSPNGDRVATSSRGRNRVEVLDPATGRSLGLFALDRAYRVAWSPSGRYLAGAGLGGVRVWDTRTGALTGSISRPAGTVAWREDERQVVIGGDDGAIQVWDAFSGKMVSEWRKAPPAATGSMASEKEPPRQVFDLRWSPDRRWLGFVTQDSVAGLLDGRTGQLIRNFPGHTGGIWRLCWSPDGSRVATAGQDGATCVYEVASGGEIAHLDHGSGNVELHALDWSPDGRQLLSGGFDYAIRIWDSQRGVWLQEVEQLSARARQRPDDLEVQRKLAHAYAEIGWADDARRSFVLARALAPDDATLITTAADAESGFSQALDVASPDADASKGPILRNPRAVGLLNTVRDRWEDGKSAAAIEAYRELARIPGAEELLPMAMTYISRSNWRAVWFPSTVDPQKDLPGWRALATSPASAAASVRLLCFPYLQRGPNELLLSSELSDRGPGAKRFGMIARTHLNLPAGKWRFRVSGGDGVRVIVNGNAILESWEHGGPTEKAATFVQAEAGDVEIAVENFVIEGTPGFQFLIEPQ